MYPTRAVVSGSRDSTLRVWNIKTGECTQTLLGHVAAVRWWVCVCKIKLFNYIIVYVHSWVVCVLALMCVKEKRVCVWVTSSMCVVFSMMVIVLLVELTIILLRCGILWRAHVSTLSPVTLTESTHYRWDNDILFRIASYILCLLGPDWL